MTSPVLAEFLAHDVDDFVREARELPSTMAGVWLAKAGGRGRCRWRGRRR